MYLNYVDYQSFGGSLEESAFNRFEFRAGKLIDIYTQSRLKSVEYEDITDEVKHCMYELIDFISNNSISGSVCGIKSAGNDGYSVSYEDKNADTAVRDIIYTYLSETGLMYRGVRQ